MAKFTRRDFLKYSGATTGLALAGCESSGTKPSAAASGAAMEASGAGGHVVVIGGGFGGAIAAKYIRKMDPSIKVTLIEANREYATCPGSNWVIGGLRDLSSITFNYDTLASKYDIKVIHEAATAIDPDAKKVTLAGGDRVGYDRLIVSPGINFRWDSIDGYDKQVAQDIPHAWKAGPQTALLRSQLEAMPNGGVFVIAAPPNPFRCPPGPYERVSMVANYLKNHKPKSKIIILDAKQKFSKQGLFTQGWKSLYGFGTDDSMIDWIPAPAGNLVAVDAASRTAMAGELEDEYKADVLNVIPAQKAGHIAEVAGLTDESGWCPVNHLTWESTLHDHIHVIGDAAIQTPLPKSGYAANSEAKVCASAVVQLLNGQEPLTPSWVNTCYSLIAPDYGISVAMVYDLTAEGKVGKVKGSGGLTPKDGNFALEAVYAESWWSNVTDDMFG